LGVLLKVCILFKYLSGVLYTNVGVSIICTFRLSECTQDPMSSDKWGSTVLENDSSLWMVHMNQSFVAILVYLPVFYKVVNLLLYMLVYGVKFSVVYF